MCHGFSWERKSTSQRYTTSSSSLALVIQSSLEVLIKTRRKFCTRQFNGLSLISSVDPNLLCDVPRMSPAIGPWVGLEQEMGGGARMRVAAVWVSAVEYLDGGPVKKVLEAWEGNSTLEVPVANGWDLYGI